MGDDQKPYIAKSFGDFLRRIAYNYLSYGYHRYVLNEIPEGKDLEAIDRKLLFNYQIRFNRSERFNRKDKGKANVAYVRYKRLFILMATDGVHDKFDKHVVQSFRESPLYLDGYSIGLKNNKPWIIIEPKRYKGVRKFLLRIAYNPEKHILSFMDRVFVPGFPGVLWQRDKLLKELNQKRKRAGRTKLTMGYPKLSFLDDTEEAVKNRINVRCK